MKDLNALRHGKEKNYYLIMLIVSCIVWLFCIIGIAAALTVGLPFLLIALFIAWLSSQYFKAVVFGNSVHVNENQFPEIYKRVADYSKELGLNNVPTVFIQNGNGSVNAVAHRVLAKKYIFLQSDLVDLMLKRGQMDELAMIIGHELAHHAAGHTAFFRNLVILPGRIVPFLGAAYGRACELTADRMGFALIGNLKATQNSLIAIALGSQALADDVSIDTFMNQEREVPEVMGFIHKIFSSHPRMTRRVIEIREFANSQPQLITNNQN